MGALGYQQSIIQFKSEEDLINELKTYIKRDTSSDQATVYVVNKTIKAVYPFKKDELNLVIGGDRHPQRSKQNLREELGLNNVKSITFIEEFDYNYEKEDLGDFLDRHFKVLEKEEVDELLL